MSLDMKTRQWLGNRIEDLQNEVKKLKLELRDCIHDEYCGSCPPGQEDNCKPRCVELTKELKGGGTSTL